MLDIPSIPGEGVAVHSRILESLGIGECFSKALDVQHNHVAATLLAYAFAQLEMKRQKLKPPEDAIRAVKERFDPSMFYHFIDQYDFSPHYDA